MSVRDKLDKPGPRKLLALDGGGIRGIITLEILEAIEHILRTALGRDDRFVLADYFDYIAGTSTGAMTATALSLGLPVRDIRDFYLSAARRCSIMLGCAIACTTNTTIGSSSNASGRWSVRRRPWAATRSRRSCSSWCAMPPRIRPGRPPGQARRALTAAEEGVRLNRDWSVALARCVPVTAARRSGKGHLKAPDDSMVAAARTLSLTYLSASARRSLSHRTACAKPLALSE